MERKLYRSRKNQMIAGVCGGLGEYVQIDPTLIRVLFALLALIGVGSGVVLYIVLLFIMPQEPEAGAEVELPASALVQGDPVVEEPSHTTDA